MPIGIVLALGFLIPIFFGVPIAYALGIMVLVGTFSVQFVSTDMLVQTYFTSCDSFPLLAIPFFILAGEIMLVGGLSKRIIDFCLACIGNRRGSLGIVTVLACMLFAAISGSGPATVAAIGGLMIPAMLKDGYDEGFSCSLVACSGAMGPIIPPSILFIMYAVMVQQSVTELFMAGIIPGIIMAVLLCGFTYFVVRKKGFGQVSRSQPKMPFRERLKAFNNAKWALLIPVIILGGIYCGFFTPTEAAVVACNYAIVVSLFIHKELKIRDLPRIFMETGKTTGYCMAFVGAATILGRLLTLENIPQQIAGFVHGFSERSWIILIVINILLLIVGCFMEPVSAIIILAPLLTPIVVSLGVNPIHFGVIMVLNLTIGMCTPPVGINMFVAAGLRGLSPEQMFKWLLPCIGILVLALLIVTFVPGICLALPGLLAR